MPVPTVENPDLTGDGSGGTGGGDGGSGGGGTGGTGGDGSGDCGIPLLCRAAPGGAAGSSGSGGPRDTMTSFADLGYDPTLSVLLTQGMVQR